MPHQVSPRLSTLSGELADDMAGEDKAGDGGDEGDAARCDFSGGRVAGGRGLDGGSRRLFRIDDGEPVNAARLEQLAHHFAERADRGPEEIVHLKPRRVEFVPGAHAADDRRAAAVRLYGKFNLRGDGVDRIDNETVTRQIEIRRVLGKIKTAARVNFRAGVDIADAGGHDIDLRLADRAVEGGELAVDVGDGDDVGIDQQQMTHARACKRLDAV